MCNQHRSRPCGRSDNIESFGMQQKMDHRWTTDFFSSWFNLFSSFIFNNKVDGSHNIDLTNEGSNPNTSNKRKSQPSIHRGENHLHTMRSYHLGIVIYVDRWKQAQMKIAIEVVITVDSKNQYNAVQHCSLQSSQFSRF